MLSVDKLLGVVFHLSYFNTLCDDGGWKILWLFSQIESTENFQCPCENIENARKILKIARFLTQITHYSFIGRLLFVYFGVQKFT